MGLNTGDNLTIVNKNRQKFYDILGINSKDVALQGQVHSINVKKITLGGIYPNTDGLYSDESCVFLAVQTADCVPIFMYDHIKKSIAIVHAGWRGAINGIVENTINLFSIKDGENLNNLNVAMGPGIQPCCFEVDEDVYSQFSNKFLKNHEQKNKRYLDLQLSLLTQLTDRGIPIQNIHVNKTCTYCDFENFYSYRRDGIYSGRMMGIIGLRY
jgi:YfiH family protein